MFVLGRFRDVLRTPVVLDELQRYPLQIKQLFIKAGKFDWGSFQYQALSSSQNADFQWLVLGKIASIFLFLSSQNSPQTEKIKLTVPTIPWNTHYAVTNCWGYLISILYDP